jgi:hypothetical protein
MRRAQLLRRIGTSARRQGIVWILDRQGASHEIWRCGTTVVPVPRHAKIGNHLAQRIFEELEPELGKDWWRQ